MLVVTSDAQAARETVRGVMPESFDVWAHQMGSDGVDGVRRPRLTAAMDRAAKLPDRDEGELHSLADIVGPCYSVKGAARMLGVDETSLPRNRLLELVTKDGVPLYAAWSFTADGQVDPLIAQVVAILEPVAIDTGGDTWSVAWWISARHWGMDGKNVPDYLAGGGNPETVFELARETAARWRI